MENVIIVFPKPEDGRNMKNILTRNGITVDAVCRNGAQALEYVNTLSGGIVICGYRFNDMYYTQLEENLPDCFDMLLVASQGHWIDDGDGKIIKLSMPIKVYDLLDTVRMMFEAQHRRRKKARLAPKERSEEDRQIISKAKSVLMDRNNMTEAEAHKYMQKCSMDSGNGLVETAKMVLCLYRAN